MPGLYPSDALGLRYDDDMGAVRSFFAADSPAIPGDNFINSAEASDEFLRSNADLFKLENIGLALAGVNEGSSQKTCRYNQYQNGIPVYGAYINVTCAKPGNRVISSVNRISYDIPVDLNEASVRISPEVSLTLMHTRFDPVFQGISHSEPALYIYQKCLVWRIEMDSASPKSYQELLINAIDGEFVEVLDRKRYYSSLPARIFRPDPVTSSQNPGLHWGSPQSLLDAELVDAVLENLDESVDSLFYLSGKWVRIADLENPVMTLPSSAAHFNYTCRDPKLLSVMAYYYIDRLAEWLASLDIPAFNKAMKGPVMVDAQALDKADNSHFVVPVSGTVYIGFGEGGTPDASDPGVITHEFGHALHYFLLGRFIRPGSFEEGFNDFLSCMFRDRFNDHGFDRANPFPWDNNSAVRWDPTRRCDMKYRFDDPGYHTFGFYKKGTVYSRALWDIFLEMGGKSKNPDDRLKAAGEITGLYLDMLIAVGDTSPVLDLANGLISSDISRTGGMYGKTIRKAFRDRGLW
jgi:hypothetical protein